MRAPDDCRVHDAVEVRASPIEGRGLFATAPIATGEMVMQLGGRLITRAELEAMIVAPGVYIDAISVDDGVDLLIPPGQDVHFCNHSCDPNIWHADAFTLVARRDIAASDEITVDYATHSDAPGVLIDCACGAASCRRVVTGTDWRLPELRERYGDHWVPVLLERIAGKFGDRR